MIIRTKCSAGRLNDGAAPGYCEPARARVRAAARPQRLAAAATLRAVHPELQPAWAEGAVGGQACTAGHVSGQACKAGRVRRAAASRSWQWPGYRRTRKKYIKFVY